MNLARLLHLSAAAALSLGSLLLAGCDSRKPDAPRAPTNQAQADGTKMAKPGPKSEADIAWEEVMKSMQPPTVPPEWKTNQPGPEAIAEFQKKQGALANATAAKLEIFYTQYATNEHAFEARDMERRLLSVAAELGHSNAIQRLQILDEARLKDPNLSEDEHLQLKVDQLQRTVLGRKDTNAVAALTELEKGVRALQKEFPLRSEIAGLLLGVAEGWMDAGHAAEASAIAREVAAAAQDPEIQEAAQGMLKTLERIGKPLALKFKALDGREIDVQAMKSKVVLIDFWATWCVPCMAELPKLKEAYARLAPKGFEIVGISLDREKSALEKTIVSEKISWPQHFDENPGGNQFAEEFQVASIPTMWLVDKKGNLREINAKEQLVEKIEKLLAE